MRYSLMGLTVIVGWETPMSKKSLFLVVDCKTRLWYKIAIKLAYPFGIVEALITGEPARTIAALLWMMKWGLKLETRVELSDD